MGLSGTLVVHGAGGPGMNLREDKDGEEVGLLRQQRINGKESGLRPGEDSTKRCGHLVSDEMLPVP